MRGSYENPNVSPGRNASLRARHFHFAAPAVAQHLMRGVVSGSAGDPATRMRARAAKIKSGDGRAILRPSGDWAHEKKLLERKIAVKNISFGEAVGSFQIERSEYLPRDDGLRHVGRVLRDFFNDAVAEKLALFVPRYPGAICRGRIE